MNRPIRRVSVFVGVLLLAVVLNLNWVQVIHGTNYRNNDANQRVVLDEYKRQRGSIVVQGTPVAESVPTKDALMYLRRYPSGPMYAPVTGFNSLLYGQSGIEAASDAVLSGSDDRLFVQRLTNLLTGRDPKGGNIVLTINKQAQSAAYQAMGNRRGSVVAIDPSTGKILAAVSTPSFDPNLLSSHSTDSIKAAWTKYVNDKTNNPMLNRAFDETYPPGSVFKVVVSAAALNAGRNPQTRIPAVDALTLPGTTTKLRNFGGERCADGRTDTLIHALTISCNTAFAQLGMDLGAPKLRDQAALFGINDHDFTVPVRVAGSSLGPMSDQASLAQSSIGQRDVRITPLQAAMISAAVANHGVLMAPYLVDEEQGPNLATLHRNEPTKYSDVMPSDQADQLAQMMQSVVDNGTGTAAQIPGIKVAGKTGTADNGPQRSDGSYVLPPHAWFSGFAPVGNARIAVAVIIENGGVAGNETTGGLAAAPVAQAVMKAYLASIGVK
jgi:peptidoglycan glycosyltransferase